MKHSPLMLVLLGVACAPSSATVHQTPATSSAPDAPGAVVSAFRKANKSTMTDGIPGETVLSDGEQVTWCDRLTLLAESRLVSSGDTVSRDDRCSLTLLPTPLHAPVAGVRVAFDVHFFFRKPYASASFDRSTRTLYVPLTSLETPWWELPATMHEWRHAYHYELARRADAAALALQSTFEGPDYKPDSFHADEAIVNVCDVLDARRAQRAIEPWRLQMSGMYIEMLENELRALKDSVSTPEVAYGLPGVRLTSAPGTKRWVGGSLADAERELGRLLPDVKAALADHDGRTAVLERLCARGPT